MPAKYLPNDLTWKQKVIYVIDRLGQPGVAQVIGELMKLEPEPDKKFLTKRASVTLTQLKGDNKVGVQTINKKGRYYIKKRA